MPSYMPSRPFGRQRPVLQRETPTVPCPPYPAAKPTFLFPGASEKIRLRPTHQEFRRTRGGVRGKRRGVGWSRATAGKTMHRRRDVNIKLASKAIVYTSVDWLDPSWRTHADWPRCCLSRTPVAPLFPSHLRPGRCDSHRSRSLVGSPSRFAHRATRVPASLHLAFPM
jgi:hypothetical protein